MTKREREAKKLLQNIVKFVNVADKTAEQVWDILTALRGPDSGAYELKKYTTARLRAVIGLNQKIKAHFADVNEIPLSASELTLRSGLTQNPHHFIYHFDAAVKAILKLFKYDLNAERKVGK